MGGGGEKNTLPPVFALESSRRATKCNTGPGVCRSPSITAAQYSLHVFCECSVLPNKGWGVSWDQLNRNRTPICPLSLPQLHVTIPNPLPCTILLRTPTAKHNMQTLNGAHHASSKRLSTCAQRTADTLVGVHMLKKSNTSPETQPLHADAIVHSIRIRMPRRINPPHPNLVPPHNVVPP